jgi:hypothetical protein
MYIQGAPAVILLLHKHDIRAPSSTAGRIEEVQSGKVGGLILFDKA